MRLLPLCIAALLVPASAAWAGQPLDTKGAAVLERADCELETSLRLVPDKLSIDASASLQASSARARRVTLGVKAGF